MVRSLGVLAIVVGACGGGAARPAPAPPASVIAQPGVGVGAIKIGMTPAEARALVDSPGEEETIEETTYVEYVDRGMTFAFEGGKLVAIHLYRGGMLGGYEHDNWKQFDLRTDKGITFASKYDDVVAAYGAPRHEGSLDKAPVPSRRVDYGGILFDFVIATGELFHVVIGAP